MTVLSVADMLGASAAGLTLLAFSQKTMLPMRLSAIGANLCFILYGALGSLYPVLALHLILVPINVFRLIEDLRMRRSMREARPAPELGTSPVHR